VADDFDLDGYSDGELDDIVDRLLRSHPDLIPDPIGDIRLPGTAEAPAVVSASDLQVPEDLLPGPRQVTVAGVEIVPSSADSDAFAPTEVVPAAAAGGSNFAPTQAMPAAASANNSTAEEDVVSKRAAWMSPRHLGLGVAAAALMLGGLFAFVQGRGDQDGVDVSTNPETETPTSQPEFTPAPPTSTPTVVGSLLPPVEPDDTTAAQATPSATAEPAVAPTDVAEPTASPVPEPTALPDPTVSPAPTAAPSPTTEPEPTPAIARPAASATPEATATPEPSPTEVPSPTPAPSPTEVPSPTPDPSPTAEATPTVTPEPEVLVGAEVASAGCAYNESYENGLVTIDNPSVGTTSTTIAGDNVASAAHVELRIFNPATGLYWIGSSWEPAAQSVFVPVSSSWSFNAPLPGGTYCVVARGRDSRNGGSNVGNTIAFTIDDNEAPAIVAGNGQPNPVNLILSPGNGATVYTDADIRMKLSGASTFRILDSSGTEVAIDPAIASELLAGTRMVVPLTPGEYTLEATNTSGGIDTHVLSVSS